MKEHISKDGCCPFKQSPKHSCKGSWVGNGPVICNMLQVGDNLAPWKDCGRYFTEATLHDLMDESGLTEFCCPDMRILFHECAEGDGYMAGGFDILKNHTDHKMVKRNFHQTHFQFCPFCGSKLGKPFVGKYTTAAGTPAEGSG